MASARSALCRLRERGIPNWWVDAKLGIFVHWTPASVPAFAPTHGTYGDLLTSGRTDAFADSPYAEWYENSLRFPSSPVARHHREVWGDRPYAAFAEDFVTGLDAWDPDEWASTFAATGARYVVLVAKHCDGWCLWPTEVTNPNVADWFSKRDLVGELATAVRRAGMRFGLYYCGGLDWTFRDTPMGSMGGVINAIPRGDYPAYADAQVRARGLQRGVADIHLLLRRCARRCRQRPLVALEPADVDRQDLNGSADDRWCRSPPGHRRRRPHPTPAAPLRCPHP